MDAISNQWKESYQLIFKTSNLLIVNTNCPTIKKGIHVLHQPKENLSDILNVNFFPKSLNYKLQS